MTAHKDLKRIIRERQKKTGESYTAARVHVMRDRATMLGAQSEVVARPEPAGVEAVVLKVNQQSARVRILGEDLQVTFRSNDVWRFVPGHLVTLFIEKRWIWRDDPYASGKLENPRIDAAKIGLEPLPLEGDEPEDVADHYEPYEPPDPYAPLWKKLTAKPRPSFEFDGIAWGALPGLDEDENPACDAAELAEIGDIEGSRELLIALCLWRLGKLTEAQQAFERILSLNPHDNQGVRFCWDDVRSGRSWKEMQEREDAARRRTLDRVTDAV